MKQGFSILILVIHMAMASLVGNIIISQPASANSRKTDIECEAQLTSGFINQINAADSTKMFSAFLLVEAAEGDGISESISAYESFMYKLQTHSFSILARESVDSSHHFFHVHGSADAFRRLLSSTPSIQWAGISKDQNTFARVQSRRALVQTNTPVATCRYVFMFTSAETLEAAKPNLAQLGLVIKDEIENMHAVLVEGPQTAIDQAKRQIEEGRI